MKRMDLLEILTAVFIDVGTMWFNIG